MDRKNTFYSMGVLMNLPGIDAFSAQKTVGSREEYFELLNEFIESIPPIISTLDNSPSEMEWKVFSEFIDNLQSKLVGIGASVLAWEAGKVAGFAHDRMHDKCDEAASLLASKLKDLTLKIQEAQKAPAARSTQPNTTHTMSQAEDVTPKQEDKLKTDIKLDAFEKLQLLIENFELDDALNMIRPMLKVSYSPAIDKSLAKIYHYLTDFDYDNSFETINNVVKFLQGEQNNEKKNVKKKILAIDDVPDVLNTVKAVLSDKYTVYGVTNHKTALKFLTNNTADLILLDIEMPDMNGFDLLGIIRKLKAYEKTPVLFLTSSVSVENVQKAYWAGGNDFIKKPIDTQILLPKIEEYLNGR